jgi:polysaccharide biosynthesis protein PslG
MIQRLLQHRRVRVGASAVGLTLIFTLALVFARPPTDPFGGDAVVDPPFTSLTYGIQAFLWWDDYWSNMHLDWIRTMVFSHVKQIFAWEDIQPSPDEFDFTRADEIVDEVERRNLRLVVRLSDAPDWAHGDIPGHKDVDFIDAPPDAEHMDDWAAFCGEVARRYRGRIAAYQLWNEPNLAREWGNQPPNAARYVEMLQVCSEAIRAADPDAILISAGMSPTGNYDAIAHPDDVYLQAMYDAGFQQYIDVVGMHAPGYTAPTYGPDDAERDGRGRWATFRRIEDLREIMVANDDAARQAAILEFGWTLDPGIHPDYAWFAVPDEETQARYMVEAYQYAADHWRPWVGLMSAIYISDPSWTPQREEYWWGITTSEGLVRLAYRDLANMAKYCGDRIIPARDPGSPEALGLVPVDPCD